MLGAVLVRAARDMSAQAVMAGHAGATGACWHNPAPGLGHLAEESLGTSSQVRRKNSPQMHTSCRQSNSERQILPIPIPHTGAIPEMTTTDSDAHMCQVLPIPLLPVLCSLLNELNSSLI